YRSGPMFGNLKRGLGLMITLDRPVTLTGGSISTTTPGTTVEVRTSPSAAVSSLDATSKVWGGTLRSGPNPFSVTSVPVRSHHVLVWITGLTQDSSGSWWSTISGVTFTGS
ncbi:MAG: hypothetical protein QM655_17020, partial [Nocardioidaceae bacterium]